MNVQTPTRSRSRAQGQVQEAFDVRQKTTMRLRSDWCLLVIFGVVALQGCSRSSEEVEIATESAQVVERIDQSAEIPDPNGDIILDGVRVGSIFTTVEIDEDLDDHANLAWDSGSMSFSAGGSFSDHFGSRNLDQIIGLLTNDSDGFEDDHFRHIFLEGASAFLIDSSQQFLILRYRPSERDISGVVVSRRSGRFVHYAGILRAIPPVWSEVAEYLNANVQVH